MYLLASDPSATIQLAAGLHAAFLEQNGQQHPGPFAAAGSSVHQLHRITVRTTERAAVGVALEEIDLRDRREPSQFVHRERERAIDHAVHQQTMLLRIDVGNAVDVVHQEVQARGRDDPIEILQRRRQRGIGDRRAGAEGLAHRVIEARRLSVRERVLETCLGLSCLGTHRLDRPHSQARQRGAFRQELPTIGVVMRTHGCLLPCLGIEMLIAPGVNDQSWAHSIAIELGVTRQGPIRIRALASRRIRPTGRGRKRPWRVPAE